MYETLAGTILGLTVGLGLALAGVLVVLIWKKDRSRKVSYLRLVVQYFLWLAFSFFYTGALAVGFFLVILVATFFSGRFFCGWICPFGFYMDLVALVRKAQSSILNPSRKHQQLLS